MLLLALLLPPLALYLLILGWINRRPHPVMAAGTWDFVGVLFAVSGFLLFAGPAFLGSLDEQSRAFWLLGVKEAAKTAPAGNWTFWIAVRILYFAIVAGGAAFVLWRCRRLTSVYNVDSRSIFPALEQAFQRIGLNPLRYGDSFLIEGKTVSSAPAANDGAIRAATEPSDLTTAVELIGEDAALRVDAFPLMRHATLRWDPSDSPVRKEVEKELAKVLREKSVAEEETILGGCLTLHGVSLFVFTCFSAAFLVLLRFVALR